MSVNVSQWQCAEQRQKTERHTKEQTAHVGGFEWTPVGDAGQYWSRTVAKARRKLIDGMGEIERRSSGTTSALGDAAREKEAGTRDKRRERPTTEETAAETKPWQGDEEHDAAQP